VIRWVEETDFERVCEEIKKRGEEIDGEFVKRVVSIWDDDLLCGYFLTCEYAGVRSFHGFKFSKGKLDIQLPLCRKYLEEERLEYSAYKTRKTKAILKILGFKDFFKQNNITVVRRICHQSQQRSEQSAQE
jgi:hypothetical protein